LTWLSHMLDCQLFGLNPGPHHLINLAFHIANTLLIFLALNRMTQIGRSADILSAPSPFESEDKISPGSGQDVRAPGSLWRSAFVAALFALHPMHVESVAWVSERKDVLSTFFFMLTLIAYAKCVAGDAGRVTREKQSKVSSLKSKVAKG